MTPKNYSRKNRNCSCLCPIICKSDSKEIKFNQEFVQVKYEVEPIKEHTHYRKLKKNEWPTYRPIWGEFKKIIELPKIFEKLDENDFFINTAYFMRDNIRMPFVSNITITNIHKYEMIKIKEERKNKLLTLKKQKKL